MTARRVVYISEEDLIMQLLLLIDELADSIPVAHVMNQCMKGDRPALQPSYSSVKWSVNYSRFLKVNNPNSVHKG